MTRAELHENLLVALDTLRTHKVRSGLTVLGIVIGVTSVISVAAIIQGLNGYISARVEAMGSRTFFVSPIPFRRRFRTRAREYPQAQKRFQMTDADV